ncbi:MAG: hypothetical protein NWF14_09340 [Candidatus Bathyarchaeota archaeon]|nr:hypothetical protein [Candidatus Bathyarchaeota archaeon]
MIEVQRVRYCYECGGCTASWPIVELLPARYHPRSLLEELSLDLTRVLRDDELWPCAWCYRSYRRCTQRLKLPEIFLGAVRRAG